MLLHTEENQDLPKEHTVLGWSQCVRHALCGEEHFQDFPDFNHRVIEKHASLMGIMHVQKGHLKPQGGKVHLAF